MLAVGGSGEGRREGGKEKVRKIDIRKNTVAQTGIWKGRKPGKQANKQTESNTHRESCGQTGIQTDRRKIRKER